MRRQTWPDARSARPSSPRTWRRLASCVTQRRRPCLRSFSGRCSPSCVRSGAMVQGRGTEREFTNGNDPGDSSHRFSDSSALFGDMPSLKRNSTDVVTEGRARLLRRALGAQPRHVQQLVLQRALLLAAAGIVGGLGSSVLLSRLLSRSLFEITPLDPATYAAVAMILLAMALAAAYPPARRAATIDPLVALRSDDHCCLR